MTDTGTTAPVAFLFPGQGSQYVGMAKEFIEQFKESKEVFDIAGDALGYDLAKLCIQGPAESLNLTANTQPAILTASIAILRVLEQRGLAAEAAAGVTEIEVGSFVPAKLLPQLADTAEVVAKRYEIARERQDAYSLESQRRVAAALSSAALHIDARQADFCAYLAAILLAGLADLHHPVF